MDETRKLMFSVIASALMLGPMGVATTPLYPGLKRSSAQTQSKNLDQKPLDEKTLDAVEFQLPCQKENVKPKSIDDLAKELPKIDRKTIELAIKSLLAEDEIVRIGEGTKQSPYAYFRAVGCGG
jgi:hypothetical protein